LTIPEFGYNRLFGRQWLKEINRKEAISGKGGV
jgi:hypothetical protein